jgi:hypothetical protein
MKLFALYRPQVDENAKLHRKEVDDMAKMHKQTPMAELIDDSAAMASQAKPQENHNE